MGNTQIEIGLNRPEVVFLGKTIINKNNSSKEQRERLITMPYKITDKDMKTYQSFQYELGKEYTTSGEGELCSPGWLHYYNDKNLAILFNPMHGNFDPETMRLFQCKAKGKIKEDKGLKFGCTSLTLTKEVIIPKISSNQRIAFLILCAKEVYKDEKWNLWADKWLSGEDRTKDTADTAARAAAYDAACAAACAYYAAYAAAVAAAVAAADTVADAAAYAAARAAIDFVAIFKESKKYK